MNSTGEFEGEVDGDFDSEFGTESETGADTSGWVPADDAASGREDRPRRDIDSLSVDPDLTPARHRIRRQRGKWGRLTEKWVPEPLRESRVDPGRRGVVLIGVIAAIAAIVAAVGVWRSKPDPRPVSPVVLAAAASDTSTAGGVTSTQTRAKSSGTGSAMLLPATVSTVPTRMIVSVTGRVRRPGVVTVVDGARVSDAIAAAGGVAADADITGLNLAARVQDGQSIVVPGPGEAGTPAGGSGGSVGTASGGIAASTGGNAVAPVDLNTADVAALDALPGVGPVTAQNIVAWREKNGQFTSVDQLQEIPGIGPAKFAQLAPEVTVS